MRIRIENFQSIELLDFESKGLTVIRGPSNTGKSSIQRAVKALIEGGRLSIDRMLRHNTDYLRVDLWHRNDHIGWVRTKKGENTFTINNQQWTKAGMDRPPELAQLGYRVVEANNKELLPQFATQHGPYFLVGEGSDSATRAEALASLSSQYIQGVSNASRQAALEERQAKQREKFTREQIEKTEKKTELYNTLPNLTQKVDAVDSLFQEVVKKQKRLNTLKTYKQVRQLHLNRKQAWGRRANIVLPKTDFYQKTEYIKRLIKLSNIHIQLQNRKSIIQKRVKTRVPQPIISINRLIRLQQLKDIRVSIKKKQKVLKITVQLPRPLDTTTLTRLTTLQTARNHLYSQKHIALERVKQSDASLLDLQEELAAIYRSNPVCPTCKKPLSKEDMCSIP